MLCGAASLFNDNNSDHGRRMSERKTSQHFAPNNKIVVAVLIDRLARAKRNTQRDTNTEKLQHVSAQLRCPHTRNLLEATHEDAPAVKEQKVLLLMLRQLWKMSVRLCSRLYSAMSLLSAVPAIAVVVVETTPTD